MHLVVHVTQTTVTTPYKLVKQVKSLHLIYTSVQEFLVQFNIWLECQTRK